MHEYMMYQPPTWFLEQFLASREWLLGLPVVYQVLVIAGLVALTVGILVLVFYIIKGVILLAIEIVKAVIKLIKSLIHAITNQANARPLSPQPPMVPAPPIAPVAPAPPKTTITPSLVTSEPTPSSTMAPNLFCPMCGKSFTPEMMTLIQQKNRVFCEYCGKELGVS
jgi:hypothetical protein